MNKYLLIMFIATFFSASSQILLKQSANQTHKNVIFEYLNWRVILSYFIFFAVLLVNTYAYTGGYEVWCRDRYLHLRIRHDSFGRDLA